MSSPRIIIFALYLATGAAARIIVGGEESKPYSRTHVVSLIDKFDDHNCGGSLLDGGQVVLTAAHCFYSPGGNLLPNVARLYSAGVHLHDYTKLDHVCSKIIEVEKVLIHPDYDARNTENDVALMFLSEPAPCAADGRTKTVTLDRSDSFDPYVGEKLMVAGWGATNKQGSKYPNRLHEVALDFIDNDACASKWGPGYIYPDVMLCAWDPNEEKGSCFADSGGPLFVDTADGGVTEIGIVSFGESTCAASKPGVYARVSHFADWIDENAFVTEGGGSLSKVESGTCASSWTTGSEGCHETQIDCPPTPCDGDAGGPWCVDVGGTSWFYCTPEPVTTTTEVPHYNQIDSGTCASAWNTGDEGCETVTQSGCPAAPCDGDKNGPWCVDVDGVSWFYCTPPEGVTTTAKPSCPATCFGQTCDHWAEADGDTCAELETPFWGCDCAGCACPNDTPTSTDPCAGLSKKPCKKQGSCSWNKNSKTCSDCSAISDKKACKKSCEWKQKSCQAVDCSGKSKKQCKKSKYKKACKYKKKRGGCIPK